MKGRSVKSNQLSLWGTRNTTSSPASAAGPQRYGSPAGQTTNPSGLEAAPASPLAAPAKEKAPGTPGIYGLSGLDSSRSTADSTVFQSRLESRLRARLAVYGSPEYDLRWKHWDIESGPPICALRASGRRTSDKGFTGWRSPDSNERGGAIQDPGKVLSRIENGHQVNLEDQAILSGWATPKPRDCKSESATEENIAKHWAHSRGKDLNKQVEHLSGWPTPNSMEGGQTSRSGDRKDELLMGGLVGWTTPRATDAKCGHSYTENMDGKDLAKDATLVPGQITTGSNAATENRGVLNPEFTRYLQGFPEGWSCSAVTEMPSACPSPSSSSKPTSNPVDDPKV